MCADLLHQGRFVEDDTAGVNDAGVSSSRRERQARCRCGWHNLFAGAARILRLPGLRSAPLPIEENRAGQDRDEETDQPSTPHLVLPARSRGRRMNPGHGCHMRRVGAVRVVREKLIGTRTGCADAIEVDEREKTAYSSPSLQLPSPVALADLSAVKNPRVLLAAQRKAIASGSQRCRSPLSWWIRREAG